MVTLNEWMNGISAILCLSTGIYFGLENLIKYFKTKKRLLPFVSTLGFLAGFLYLGTSVNFVVYVISGNNIRLFLYGWLSYMWIPPATVIALTLGFDLFMPKYKKHVTYIFSGLWAIYWFCLFIFPNQMLTKGNDGEDELLEISLLSVVRIITTFYILVILFIQSGGYLRLRKKMIDHGINKKAILHVTYLGIGWFFFAFSSILDTIVPSRIIHAVVIARILMIIGYCLIFIGFHQPKLKTASKESLKE